MKRETIIALVIGLALGAIATYALMELKLQTLDSRQLHNWLAVVVAHVEIQSHSVISRGMLDLVMVPEEVRVRGAVREIEKVEGRTTTRLMRAGDQFRSTDLAAQ